VGGQFFSEATMKTPRPEYEIRAQWTGLSADDQAAVRSRCAATEGNQSMTAASGQEGSAGDDSGSPACNLADGTEAGDAALDTGSAGSSGQAGSQTTTTGSVNGVEVQSASPSPSPAPDTGLAGGQGESQLVLICDLIATL
jgi:hypothetical protein